ncbi:MAG: trehalose-phosphatase [Desulfotomaculales bacterium]
MTGSPVVPDANLAIFLDYDGTLAPIVDRPENAMPFPGIPAILCRLVRCQRYRVAVVSGRPLAQLRAWVPEGPVLVGVHGAEWLFPGAGLERLQLSGPVQSTLDDFYRRLQEIVPQNRGFLIEYKEVAVAVHYRLAAEEHTVPVLARVKELIEAFLPPADWVVVEGHKVMEVRPRQAGKGRAVQRLCERWPSYTPLYVGDDATDEDAFEAVNRAGGISILVAAQPRRTAARYRLAGPAAVADFLQGLVIRHDENGSA